MVSSVNQEEVKMKIRMTFMMIMLFFQGCSQMSMAKAIKGGPKCRAAF